VLYVSFLFASPTDWRLRRAPAERIVVHFAPPVPPSLLAEAQVGRNAVELFASLPTTTPVRGVIASQLFKDVPVEECAKMLQMRPESVKRMQKRPLDKEAIKAIFRFPGALCHRYSSLYWQGFVRMKANEKKNEQARQYMILKAPNPSGRHKRYFCGSEESFYDGYLLWAQKKGNPIPGLLTEVQVTPGSSLRPASRASAS
jgi:hypothetical protein